MLQRFQCFGQAARRTDQPRNPTELRANHKPALFFFGGEESKFWHHRPLAGQFGPPEPNLSFHSVPGFAALYSPASSALLASNTTLGPERNACRPQTFPACCRLTCSNQTTSCFPAVQLQPTRSSLIRRQTERRAVAQVKVLRRLPSNWAFCFHLTTQYPTVTLVALRATFVPAAPPSPSSN